MASRFGFQLSNRRMLNVFFPGIVPRVQQKIEASSLPPAVINILTHPAGPLTIHFWAPTFKWMISVTNLVDLNRPIEKMSGYQQASELEKFRKNVDTLVRNSLKLLIVFLFIALIPVVDIYLLGLFCSAFIFTGLIWSRYSFVITPINYNLFLVNFSLFLTSAWHMSRIAAHEWRKRSANQAELADIPQAVAS